MFHFKNSTGKNSLFSLSTGKYHSVYRVPYNLALNLAPPKKYLFLIVEQNFLD